MAPGLCHQCAAFPAEAWGALSSPDLKLEGWSSHCGSAGYKPASILEEVGLILGLARWVKYLVLLWLWCRRAAAALTPGLGTSRCRSFGPKETKLKSNQIKSNQMAHPAHHQSAGVLYHKRLSLKPWLSSSPPVGILSRRAAQYQAGPTHVLLFPAPGR